MTDEKSRSPAPEEEAGQAVPEEQPAPEAESGEEAAPDAGGADEALREAEARADQYWNEFLRARAELDNLQKRARRDADQARAFAIERFVKDLLPVKDSLEQGLEAAREESAGAEKLVEGKELILKMFEKVLADHGVEQVDPQGEKFDPERHEAMTTQPSEDQEPDTVLMVLQKGYVLNGRLVRPARVVVATTP